MTLREYLEGKHGRPLSAEELRYLENAESRNDAIFAHLREREHFAERRHRSRDHPAFRVLLQYGAVRHNAALTRYVWLLPVCELLDLKSRLGKECGTLRALCERFELPNGSPINYVSEKNNPEGLLPRRIRKALAAIGYGTFP